jgi:DNA topoisomerase VI subunit A
VTLREIYYLFKGSEFGWKNQNECNEAIMDVGTPISSSI